MNTATNIWGTKTNSYSIETALLEQIEIESVLAELAASRANKFDAAAVIVASGVAVVEYAEKQFNGEGMADEDWASI